MWWRVLWQPGLLDQKKEGVQCNKLSILVGRSPTLLGDRPLHFSKKKKSMRSQSNIKVNHEVKWANGNDVLLNGNGMGHSRDSATGGHL